MKKEEYTWEDLKKKWHETKIMFWKMRKAKREMQASRIALKIARLENKTNLT